MPKNWKEELKRRLECESDMDQCGVKGKNRKKIANTTSENISQTGGKINWSMIKEGNENKGWKEKRTYLVFK